MPGLVLDHITPVALAYRIMCDGSLDGEHKNSTHPRVYKRRENQSK